MRHDAWKCVSGQAERACVAAGGRMLASSARWNFVWVKKTATRVLTRSCDGIKMQADACNRMCVS